MRFLVPAVLVAVVLTSACASSRAVPRPYPGGTTPPAPAAAASTTELARSLSGSPYRAGGSDPTGFDCSGLVQYVFSRVGIPLPRSVREQMARGVAVAADEIAAGDLLFFAIDGRVASHVGIAVGSDRFVHAPSSGGRVREERLSADYWRRRFVGARRVQVD